MKFAHKALPMTDEEIVREWRLAKIPKKQVEILAQGNQCDKQLIVRILYESGALNGTAIYQYKKIGLLPAHLEAPTAIQASKSTAAPEQSKTPPTDEPTEKIETVTKTDETVTETANTDDDVLIIAINAKKTKLTQKFVEDESELKARHVTELQELQRKHEAERAELESEYDKKFDKIEAALTILTEL